MGSMVGNGILLRIKSAQNLPSTEAETFLKILTSLSKSKNPLCSLKRNRFYIVWCYEVWTFQKGCHISTECAPTPVPIVIK